MDVNDWFNPRWFHPAQLADTWRRERMRAKTIRLLTVVCFLLLCTNIVTLPAAFAIDSLGLDLFLSVVELNFAIGLVLTFGPLWRRLVRRVPRRTRVAVVHRARYWHWMRVAKMGW
jgi:hypothetical protein